jgi:hypothetical protein
MAGQTRLQATGAAAADAADAAPGPWRRVRRGGRGRGSHAQAPTNAVVTSNRFAP